MALDALVANEAVVANEALVTNEAVVANEALVANEAVVANEALVANDAEVALDALIAYDAVNGFIKPDCPLMEPVILNDPEREMSYASVPVNASIDWVTWYASTAFPVSIPTWVNVFAIFYDKYL